MHRLRCFCSALPSFIVCLFIVGLRSLFRSDLFASRGASRARVAIPTSGARVVAPGLQCGCQRWSDSPLPHRPRHRLRPARAHRRSVPGAAEQQTLKSCLVRPQRHSPFGHRRLAGIPSAAALRGDFTKRLVCEVLVAARPTVTECARTVFGSEHGASVIWSRIRNADGHGVAIIDQLEHARCDLKTRPSLTHPRLTMA